MSVQLFEGDCLDVMKQIPAASVDLVLCDLPYGTTDCRWDVILPFEKLWHEYNHISKKGTAVVLTSAQPFTSKLILSNLEMFRYDLIWDKTNRNTGYGNANRMPLRSHEHISIFYKSLPTYNPQMTVGKAYNAKRSGKRPDVYSSGGLHPKDGINLGIRYPISILAIAADIKTELGLHQTQKPEVLMEYLIKTYSNEGDTVLDNCMGSGTTGVACVNTDRKFIGIEKDAKYFQVAKERIERAVRTREQRLF